MADPIAPVAPTAAAGSPRAAAAAQAKSVTPTPVAPVEAAKPSAPAPDEVLKRAEAERKAAYLEKRQTLSERKKWDDEKKSWGAKLTEYETLKKAQQNAKLDPISAAKTLWGDDWYSVMTEAKINGVAPANLIASEIERIKEDFDKKLAAKDEDAKKAQQTQQQQSVEQARHQLTLEAGDFWKTSSAEYPALDALGDERAISQAIANQIEQTYNQSEQRDDDGRLLRPGRVLTNKEAAEQIENNILGLAEKVASGAKYQEKLRAKLMPVQNPAGQSLSRTQNPVVPQGVARTTQTKTLSNDLTGSTPSRSPRISDAERMKRATERYNEVASRNRGNG